MLQKYPKRFRIPILQSFSYEICYCLKKVANFLTVSAVFFVYKQNFRARSHIRKNTKISVLLICVELTLYLHLDLVIDLD